MGKIDQLTNEYMSDKARFADVFNYFVYDGRQVLIPEHLQELSTVEQVFPYGKNGKTQELQRFRDVLKNACVMTDEQERTYILLGIENQSYIHYAAPVKDMLYDAMNFTALLAGDAEFRHLDRMSAEVINVVTGSNLEFKNEGGEVDVCKAIEQIRENAMTEGAKQGAKYGEEKGILNSIRNLMETTSWTAQAAMDALKIPEADRAGYLAKL